MDQIQLGTTGLRRRPYGEGSGRIGARASPSAQRSYHLRLDPVRPRHKRLGHVGKRAENMLSSRLCLSACSPTNTRTWLSARRASPSSRRNGCVEPDVVTYRRARSDERFPAQVPRPAQLRRRGGCDPAGPCRFVCWTCMSRWKRPGASRAAVVIRIVPNIAACGSASACRNRQVLLRTRMLEGPSTSAAICILQRAPCQMRALLPSCSALAWLDLERHFPDLLKLAARLLQSALPAVDA